MLPTLAERLREQQAKTRSRPASRHPWPLSTDPPTALLFQPRHEVAGLEAVAPPEPVAPTPPQSRTALAEMLLLLFWAVLVLIDGALALASLLDRAAARELRRPGPHRQRITPAAPSSAGVSDSPGDTEATTLLQGCRSLAPSL
ncbi:hypothetical protein [Synechococcus sp. CS-1332]|uniref:hypothetical protein n=1 Tax=Synechococcus sp. CS-1332 TaxID=2847972 RepID=UPI00223B2466|nr:hypothetical protein [Synechococcus sp. CS-1332]MCT0208384.1 hypothetical protein [Synechococcus sp. CS-1332]